MSAVPRRPRGDWRRAAIPRIVAVADVGAAATYFAAFIAIPIIVLFGQRWDYYCIFGGFVLIVVGSTLSLVLVDKLQSKWMKWKRAGLVGLSLGVGSVLVNYGWCLSTEYAQNDALLHAAVEEWSHNQESFMEFQHVRATVLDGKRLLPLPTPKTLEIRRFLVGVNFSLGIAEPDELRRLLREYVLYMDDLAQFTASYNTARASQESTANIRVHFNNIVRKFFKDRPGFVVYIICSAQVTWIVISYLYILKC